MSVITIIAEPITVMVGLEVFADAIRIPQRDVIAENRVEVRREKEVVGNGLYEVSTNFPYGFNGGSIII